MNQSISEEFLEISSVNGSLINDTEDCESVIDAEIIENYPLNSATPKDYSAPVTRENDHEGSLVYQSPPSEEGNLVVNDSFFLVKNASLKGLESLTTPWGMSSIFLLLLGNILLSWAQFSPSPSLTTTQNTPETAIIPIQQPSKQILKQPNSLGLDSLSRLPSSSLAVVKASPLPQFSPSQAPKSVTMASPHPSLTTALLPPSLLPQLVQNVVVANPKNPNSPTSVGKKSQNPISPTLPGKLDKAKSQNRTISAIIPVKVPPVRLAPLSPPLPVSQSVPIPPPIKPTIEILPSPAPENPEKAKAMQDLIRHQMVDNQQRAETTPPLGFNQETRLKMQAIQNQTNLNSAEEQLQQLQQQYPANQQ